MDFKKFCVLGEVLLMVIGTAVAPDSTNPTTNEREKTPVQQSSEVDEALPQQYPEDKEMETQQKSEVKGNLAQQKPESKETTPHQSSDAERLKAEKNSPVEETPTLGNAGGEETPAEKIPAQHQSRDEYAKSIIHGRNIKQIDPKELPNPDSRKPKFIITDDSTSIKDLINENRFVPKYLETPVPRVERQTGFRLTVQNHWDNNLLCIQRIRVYEEKEKLEDWRQREEKEQLEFLVKQAGEEFDAKLIKPKYRKFKSKPRDEFLARCEGRLSLSSLPSKYRFGFAGAIHFDGANRLIYRIQDKDEGYFCHERTYTPTGRRVRRVAPQECETIIDRIHKLQGSIRNLLLSLYQ